MTAENLMIFGGFSLGNKFIISCKII